MNCKCLYFLLVVPTLFLGCEHLNILEAGGGIMTEFNLVDPAGDQTQTFKAGQDIRLTYAMTNQTGGLQGYINPDTGPIVSFEIFRDDSLLGTSDDGVAYALVLVEGQIEASETIVWEYNWYSADLHEPLPSGKYKARARPRLHFSAVSTPKPEEIEFEIVCDTSAQSCDSSGLVIITGQPPASIQLDPFQLNTVEIVGDTISLNLSYSGGCNEHDYTLFMSPAAFLESLPVQTNLFLRHNGHDDACDAVINTDVSFNLRSVAELHRQFYGRNDEIIINVFDYFEGQPDRHVSASYSPN